MLLISGLDQFKVLLREKGVTNLNAPIICARRQRSQAAAVPYNTYLINELLSIYEADTQLYMGPITGVPLDIGGIESLHDEKIRYLIKNGVDLTSIKRAKSALQVICEDTYLFEKFATDLGLMNVCSSTDIDILEIVRTLLNHNEYIDYNTKDKDGWTIFMYACANIKCGERLAKFILDTSLQQSKSITLNTANKVNYYTQLQM
jgi:hypothetical protein